MNNLTANSTQPTVIAESATLKTGQILKSRKSMTQPNNKRSNKFPIAPPIINAKLNLIHNLSFFKQNEKIVIRMMVRPEIQMKNWVACGKIPKALPVFFTKVIEKIFSMTENESPTDKFLVKIIFVILSKTKTITAVLQNNINDFL